MATKVNIKKTRKAGVIMRVYADQAAWIRTPQSSNVYAIAYYADFHRLFIQFHKDGVPTSRYVYHNFPPDQWYSFQGASSKGSFVWYEIRNAGADDRYDCEEI